MTRAIRSAQLWLIVATILACAGGEKSPGDDPAPPEPMAAAGGRPAASTVWRWDRRAGAMFALPAGVADAVRLVNVVYSDERQLDSLMPSGWSPEGTSLDLISGGATVGTGQVTDVRFDASCAGWPAARIAPLAAASPQWRVAFEADRVNGVAFDSLPALDASDSVSVTTTAARAASRLVDDTATAFRGRPFIVRQASRFAAGDGGVVTLVEIVRLVPQEANPLQEQIVMIQEAGSPGQPGSEAVFHVRSIGLEESLSSVELLAVLRVKATGRLALLLRRDRESGFLLQWIERISPGHWSVTWQSALDSC